MSIDAITGMITLVFAAHYWEMRTASEYPNPIGSRDNLLHHLCEEFHF